MNGDDQFENRLQGLPQRPIPEAWRRQILDAAREPKSRRSITRPALLSKFDSLMARWLWPHPKAWAGLAAVWLLVLGSNFAAREPARPELARQATYRSPQMLEVLREQEQLLAELVGPIEKPKASRPKHPLPEPRSQRREKFLRASFENPFPCRGRREEAQISKGFCMQGGEDQSLLTSAPTIKTCS